MMPAVAATSPNVSQVKTVRAVNAIKAAAVKAVRAAAVKAVRAAVPDRKRFGEITNAGLKNW